MNVYTCTDHDGHYPVGVASVVVANSEAEAYELLRAALNKAGLDGDLNFTLEVLPLHAPHAVILNNGDY